MNSATLCFVINRREKKILLGMKKRGFGQGKWNGFGGKVNAGEAIKAAAIRETAEEALIKVSDVEKVAELTFVFPYRNEWNQTVHVYLASKWAGEVSETEEMLPKWFDFSGIPFDEMWQDDANWLPKVLNGEKVKATFEFKPDNETINSMAWEPF